MKGINSIIEFGKLKKKFPRQKGTLKKLAEKKWEDLIFQVKLDIPNEVRKLMELSRPDDWQKTLEGNNFWFGVEIPNCMEIFISYRYDKRWEFSKISLFHNDDLFYSSKSIDEIAFSFYLAWKVGKQIKLINFKEIHDGMNEAPSITLEEIEEIEYLRSLEYESSYYHQLSRSRNFGGTNFRHGSIPP